MMVMLMVVVVVGVGAVVVVAMIVLDACGLPNDERARHQTCHPGLMRKRGEILFASCMALLLLL